MVTRRCTYTTGELIGMCVIVGVFVAFLVFATMRDHAGMEARAGVVNTCNAPCVVTFDNGTHTMTEDAFGVDYHDGVVEVFRVVP